MLTFLKKLASAIPTPGKGKVTLYVSDTGVPGYKDETGEAHTLAGTDGVGVPAGGEVGQLLRKASTGDYEAEWYTVTSADIGAVTSAQLEALEARVAALESGDPDPT